MDSSWWSLELNQLLCEYAEEYELDFESISQNLRLEICHRKWTNFIPVELIDTQACNVQWKKLMNSTRTIKTSVDIMSRPATTPQKNMSSINKVMLPN